MPSNLVHELTGRRLVRGDVGIEIETEAKNPYAVPAIEGWMSKGDGSLRNFGVEYITQGAIPIDEVDKYIDNWRDGLGKIWERLDKTSHSTSVHVHSNVSQFTVTELVNFFCLATLFENVLCEFSGVDRKGNLFCLRTKDAETKINSIIAAIKSAQSQNYILRSLSPGNYKYCGINTETVKSFNSLEFRMMRGEMEPDIIKKWVKAIHNISVYSRKFECPKAILKVAKEKGVMHLYSECFGDLAGDFSYTKIVEDIECNLYYVANIASKQDIKALPASAPKSNLSAGTYQEILERVARVNAPQPNVVNPVVADEGFTEDFEEEDF